MVADAGFLGYDPILTFSSNDNSRGSVASSLPSECDFALTSQDPYNIRTYGFKIDPMPNDFRTVASSKLIEMVSTNDDVTNDIIADEVLKALLEDPEYAQGEYWLVAVDDSSVTNAGFQEAAKMYEGWNVTNFHAKNLAGKSLFVAGSNDILDQIQRCQGGPPVDSEIFHIFIESAIQDSSNNGTEIMQKIDDGDELLGFDTMIIFTTDSPTAEVKTFLNEICSYQYSNANDNWKISYYGLPK